MNLYQHKNNIGVEWRSYGNPKTNPKFEGSILNDKPNGSGKLTYSNGNKFEGFWKNGEPNGEGTFSWTDGRSYSGFFKNGEPNGEGTYTSSDGTKKTVPVLYNDQNILKLTLKNNSFPFTSILNKTSEELIKE